MKSFKYNSTIIIAVLSMLVGVIYTAPNLIYLLEMGKNYKGIALANAQDEWSYLGLIREVMDGNTSLKNWYFWEQKLPGEPSSYMSSQFLPYWLVGTSAKMLSIPMDVLVIIIKFLFPAALFILLHSWLFSFIRNRLATVLGALAAVLMPVIWTGDFVIFNWSLYWDFHLVFLRPGIQVAALFWMLSLLLWSSSIQKDKIWYSILGAFALSATVYSYLFYWTYIYALLIVFTLFSLIFKRRKWLKHTLIILLGSVALSVYAWVRLFQTAAQANIWTSNAFGIALPHAPSLSLFQGLILFMILTCVWTYRKKWLSELETFTLISLAAAHIICMNQQVITGISLELHHYEIFVTPVIFTIIFTVFLFRLNNDDFKAYLKERSRRLWPVEQRKGFIFLILAVLVVLMTGAILAHRFPNPGTGGLPGKMVRLIWMIDKRLITWAIGFAVLGVGIFGSQKRSFRYLISFFSIFFIGLLTQISSYSGTRKGFATLMQDYGPAFDWLNTHTPAESVVLCNPLTADFAVVYTHNNVYFADWAVFTNPEIFQDRALRLFYFIGLSSDQLRSALSGASAAYDIEVKSIFFYWRPVGEKNQVKMDRGRFLKCYTHDEIESVITRYQRLQEGELYTSLKKYRIDYLVYGPVEGSGNTNMGLWGFQRNINALSFLKNVFYDGQIAIYAVE